MRFIQRYKSPKFIGVSDDVRYKGKDYQVLINYIKGETDAKNSTPKNDRPILIANNGDRITCHNYKELEILSSKKLINRNSIMNCTLDQNLDMSNSKSG